jgi:hypothetical protein
VTEGRPGSDLGETPPPSGQAAPPADVAPPPSDAAPPLSDAAPPPTEQAGPVAGGPQDTDDLRGFHMRRLLRKPLTLSLGSTFVIAGFVAGILIAGPVIGLAFAAGVALIVLLIVFLIASSKAADDFYRAYAAARGLSWSGDREKLPPVTPLLRKGDDRYSENTFRGTLPGGIPGVLSLFTYEEESTDSKGNRQTSYYHFTVALFDMPDLTGKVAKLYCNRKSGFKFLEGVEDTFRKNKRLHLESEALDDRYEIFYGPNEDENWLRQLFSPSFIVWLTEQAPKNFAFELESGELCVDVKGHDSNAAQLDALCATAGHVAGRLRGEAGED